MSINDLLETYRAQFYLKYGTQKSTIANCDAKKVLKLKRQWEKYGVRETRKLSCQPASQIYIRKMMIADCRKNRICMVDMRFPLPILSELFLLLFSN